MAGKQPGLFVIGLTGNIGTGKSVVRRMLEHLGAYGIDADLVGHEAFEQGSASYEKVIDRFGREILTAEGEIDRKILGRIVFSSAERLGALEDIVHPYVREKIGRLLQDSPSPVVALEAIKLFEGRLDEICDSLWATCVPEEQQLQRLVDGRKMDRRDAHRRIDAQSPQEEKIRRSNVIIHTGGNFTNTWQQVYRWWEHCVPGWARDGASRYGMYTDMQSGIKILQADPSFAEAIVNFLRDFQPENAPLSEEDITALFAEHRFLLLFQNGNITASLEFQVERQMSKTTRIGFSETGALQTGLTLIVRQMEKISHDYHCRVAFIMPGDFLPVDRQTWMEMGYNRVEGIWMENEPWESTALKLLKMDGGLLYKILA